MWSAERDGNAHYAIYECVTMTRAAHTLRTTSSSSSCGGHVQKSASPGMPCADGICLPMRNPQSSRLRLITHSGCCERAIDRLTHISGKKRHFPRQFSLSLALTGIICIKSDRASRARTFYPRAKRVIKSSDVLFCARLSTKGGFIRHFFLFNASSFH